jgi:hypothetical protein
MRRSTVRKGDSPSDGSALPGKKGDHDAPRSPSPVAAEFDFDPE